MKGRFRLRHYTKHIEDRVLDIEGQLISEVDFSGHKDREQFRGAEETMGGTGLLGEISHGVQDWAVGMNEEEREGVRIQVSMAGNKCKEEGLGLLGRKCVTIVEREDISLHTAMHEAMGLLTDIVIIVENGDTR